MSEETQSVTEQAPAMSDADLFYSNQNATTDADTASSTTVEAEAVEAGKPAIDEVSGDDVNTESTEASAESETEDAETSNDSDEPLYYQIGDEEISETEVKEWRENGLRQADYTKKTQSLADERKGFETEKTQVAGLAETLKSHIDALEVVIGNDLESVDMDHLREYDLSEYLRVKEERETKLSKLDEAKATAQKLKEDADLQQLTGEQAKLKELFPDWADPATGQETYKKDSALIESYVQKNGFNEEDFSHLTSATVMQAIHKAALFDAMKEESQAVEKQVRKAPKAIKAGAKKIQTKKSTSTAELFYGKTKQG